VTFRVRRAVAWRDARNRGGHRPVWVVLAGAGILLTLRFGREDLDGWRGPRLLAGGFGRGHLLSVRVGRVFPGASGLALAMAAARCAVPVGGSPDAGGICCAGVLAVAAAVEILSSAISYSLEWRPLRRIARGRVRSREHRAAVAALAGFIGSTRDWPPRAGSQFCWWVLAASGRAARNAHATRDGKVWGGRLLAGRAFYVE